MDALLGSARRLRFSARSAVIEAGRHAFATRRRHLVAGVALLAPLSFLAARTSQETADLIITNAAVYTLSWPEPTVDGSPSARAPHNAARGWHPDAQAVAARGGRIVFVGSNAGALRMRGSSTRVTDAHGATLLPGLVDAHVHLANLGASLRRVNLVGVTTEEEAVRRVE